MNTKDTTVYNINNVDVMKVTKATANILYKKGCEIFMLPCNIFTDNPYFKASFIEPNNEPFINRITEYMQKNCNKHTGQRVHYYVSESYLSENYHL